MTLRERLAGREARIEEAVMADPSALGYPDAAFIRNCRVPSVVGCPDLLLLPRTGRHRLVLVEAKAARAADAASKVVGQLLMYYSGALTIGSDGLRLYTQYALEHPESARDRRRTSAKKVRGGRLAVPGKADPLTAGTPLTPAEVALIVALDADPHPSLIETLRVLREHHHFNIGLAVLRQGKIVLSAPAG